MPIKDAPAGVIPSDCDYIVFYASIDPSTGQMWCGDCRDVEHLVHETFKPDGAPNARIVYVGLKPEWKNPDHGLRKTPFFLKSIPTIVKLKDGQEVGRLVEGEVAAGLAAFLRA